MTTSFAFSLVIVIGVLAIVIAETESYSSKWLHKESYVGNNGSLTQLPSKVERYNVPYQLPNPKRCDVLYDGRCYVLIMSMARMGLGEAEQACEEVNGKLANVYSEEHFHLLRALIRSRVPIGETYNHVWTGMTVDVSSGRIRLSNGHWAPYIHWCPKRPVSPPGHYVVYHVDLDNKSNNQGLWDLHDPSYRLLGGICQL